MLWRLRDNVVESSITAHDVGSGRNDTNWEIPERDGHERFDKMIIAQHPISYTQLGDFTSSKSFHIGEYWGLLRGHIWHITQHERTSSKEKFRVNIFHLI